MAKDWQELILKNFKHAASTYNEEAHLQRDIAWQLAKKCSQQEIPKGIWVDLGAGTGLLAEALEALNPNQSVIRVDGNQSMLDLHPSESQTQLFDLNLGLPSWPSHPTLIASNFALHWLINPNEKLKEWFLALAPRGWLAIALPVKGSFPEWHSAANLAGVNCSATPLPDRHSLLRTFPKKNIRYQNLHILTQEAQEVISLLKPFTKVGAHSSPHSSLKIRDWRNLIQAWPKSQDSQTFQLTWLIQLALVQR